MWLGVVGCGCVGLVAADVGGDVLSDSFQSIPAGILPLRPAVDLTFDIPSFLVLAVSRNVVPSVSALRRVISGTDSFKFHAVLLVVVCG